MAGSFKSIAPGTPPSVPASLSADSSTIAKEAVALEAGRSKSLKRSHADAMGSPGTPVDPYLQSMASSPKLARLDAQQDSAAAAADAVAALLGGGRLKDEQMHPGLSDATGYRVLTELSADNMAPGHHVGDPEDESALQHDAHDAHGVDQPQEHEEHDPQEHDPQDDEHHEQHEHHEHDEHDPQHHQIHESSDPHTYDPQGHHDAHDTASSHDASDGMGMGGVPVTESPTPMEVDARIDPAMGPSESFHDDKSGVSMSYPGAFQSMDGSLPPTPTRGMTYPEGAMSSGMKKYKCNDCNAEFTRHHNLKSHQLTHSQDKPFKCDDCDMRFRRLHDLKRHGKLHTGEKPHVCTKCNRKFARGDALVRHTKGVMGCSTARNSLGGHGEDGEMDGPSMMDGDDTAISGIMYGTDGDVGDEDQRRLSLPALKTQPTVAQGAHGRTYPQSNSRGPFTASPGAHSAGGNFAPTATMTDSPKPMANGQRSQTGGQHANHRPKQLPNIPVFGPGDARYQQPNGARVHNTTAVVAQFQEMLAGEVKKFEEKITTMEQAHRAQIAAQNTELRTQYAQIQVLEHELSLVKAQYVGSASADANVDSNSNNDNNKEASPAD